MFPPDPARDDGFPNSADLGVRRGAIIITSLRMLKANDREL
jgi:hypothetical protein